MTFGEWIIYRKSGGFIEVRNGDGEVVCDNEPYYPQAITEANAELIVKAVNYYKKHAAL